MKIQYIHFTISIICSASQKQELENCISEAYARNKSKVNEKSKDKYFKLSTRNKSFLSKREIK